MDSSRSNYVRKLRRRGRVKWALSYIGADRRRHQEVTEASTREAAKLLLAKKVRDVIEQKVAGTEIRPKITFSAFARKYLAHQQSLLEPNSYDRVRAVVQNCLEPVFGRLILSEIRPRDVQEYVNERALTVYTRKDDSTKRIAPATVKRELEVTSGVFSRAIDWDYLVTNPVKKVRFRKFEWRKQRILSLEEQDLLFAAFEKNDRRRYLADVVTVALHTGMREGEILRLTWADVDFATKKITVRSTNENPTKGKRTRAIPMSENVHSVLSRLYVQAVKATGGNAPLTRDRTVFVNPRTGTRYTDTKFAWYASLEDAQIEGLRFHDLRHTFATRAVQGGCKLPALQQVLGHRDITTTMRYVHMLGLDLEDVIDCVEGYEEKRFDSLPEDRQLAHYRQGGAQEPKEAASA